MKVAKFLIIFSALAVIENGCSNANGPFCQTGCGKDAAINNNTTTMEKNNTESDNDHLVCTLTGAEQARQKERLQHEIFSTVKDVEEIESGYIFSFDYEEQFILKMTDYVITENNCCPFFQFDIVLKAKEDAKLKITGSPKAKEMIRMTLVDRE